MVTRAFKAWYHLGIWQHVPTKRQLLLTIVRTIMTVLVAIFPLLLTVVTMYYPTE